MLKGTLLYLAQNDSLRNFVIHNPAARTFARRFVAGEKLDDASEAIRALNQRGMHVSLDHLGENVSDASPLALLEDSAVRDEGEVCEEHRGARKNEGSPVADFDKGIDDDRYHGFLTPTIEVASAILPVP